MDRDEELFDAYLDLALQGRAGTPDQFLAEHGGDAPTSEATRERLEAIHRAMGRGPRAGPDGDGDGAAVVEEDRSSLSDGALHTLLREASSHGGTASSVDGALDPGLLAGRLAPGQLLGDYRLERPLGGGGMGIVWLAEQRSLGRRVALKLIRPELVASATSVERFRREAQAAARVNHPHAVALYEHGVVDGLAFMAMEYVDGEGLDEAIVRSREQGTPLVTTDVLRWAAELAEALQAAHAAGLVHRDVKPSNVRLDGAGRARLLDFGVVRLVDGAGSTLTGAFAGSPPYAAPEQISGVAEDIDARTDLYALGVLLYECLTGRVPFEGLVTEQLFHRILVQEPPSPRTLRPDLPRDLELVVLKCLEKRPERRYASARELAADLRALLELRPVAARPPGALRRLGRWRRRHPLAAGGLVALLVLALVLAGWRVADGLAERERQRQRALAAVEAATRLVDEYEQRVGRAEAWVRPALKARTALHTQWFPPDARRRTEQDVARLAALDRSREQAFQAGLDALQLTELLDGGRQPELAEQVRRLRARHYRNRYGDLAQRENGSRLEVLAGLVDRYDEEGRYEQLLRPRQVRRLAVDPPDARLFAFRWAEQADLVEGGEPRLVPVPVGPAGLPVEPGRWCLEVRADAPPLRRGDLVVATAGHGLEGLLLAPGGPGQLQRGDRVLSVDGVAVADLADLTSRSTRREDGGRRRFEVQRGPSLERLQAADLAALGRVLDGPGLTRLAGTSLTVLREGELVELASPGPFEGRLTAAPLLIHPHNDLAVGDGSEVELPDEPLLLLALHPDRHPRRIVLGPGAPPDGGTTRVALLPRESVPPGFLVVDPSLIVTSLRVERPLLLAEREVTAGEYLEFLNDPRTLAAVEDADTTVRVPRSLGDQHTGGSWPRGPDGRFSLPPDLDPAAPVTGVSWEDAVAYCAWLDRRAAAAGLDLSHRLPTGDEWILAASGGTNREYPFGDSFRSWWAKSCFARPTATLEPVLSYPVDESPFGVFDLAGSVQEWCQDWWVQATNRRRYAGGAWPFSNDGTHFRCWGANGGLADAGYVSVGLRVAADSKALDVLGP